MLKDNRSVAGVQELDGDRAGETNVIPICRGPLSGDAPPRGALTWNTAQHKGHALRQWRLAVCGAFGESARILRVAWALSNLFCTAKGFAFPTDATLSAEAGVSLRKLQAALTELEQGGAIIRVNRKRGPQAVRHIYPAATLIPPPVGGIIPPPKGADRKG